MHASQKRRYCQNAVESVKELLTPLLIVIVCIIYILMTVTQRQTCPCHAHLRQVRCSSRVVSPVTSPTLVSVASRPYSSLAVTQKYVKIAG